VADYAITLLEHGDTTPLRAKLLVHANAIENLRSSAIFEDREIRDRSDRLRLLDTALIDAIGIAQPLGQQLDALERRAYNKTGLDDAIADATAAIGHGAPPQWPRTPLADVCCGRRLTCLSCGRCAVTRQCPTRK
jgi:hypothetical protein